MKENWIAFGLLAAAVASWLWATTARAEEHPNNIAISKCLAESGYDKTAPIEERMKFNFTKPAGCASKRIAEVQQVKDLEQRAFLEANPWYKGSNFKWEERAEYNCEKIYSTALLNTITVCSKPIYIN